MADNKIYRIWIDGRPVEVSQDVYRAYHSMGRRERYLEERDLAHGKTLYADMDTDEMTGEDAIPDLEAIPVEDAVETLLMVEKLRKCVALLRETERELLDALFFGSGGDGMTEREYACKLGVSQISVHKRKRRILSKLKKMI